MQLGKDDAKPCQKKDKLQETKLAERLLKDAHKAELRQQKLKNKEEKQGLKSVFKELRVSSSSKRAEKEHREAMRRAQHKENGQECQHGVWRCRICFPHPPAGRRIHAH
ncbi:hypothetical protein COCOBI_13-2140 [Coccomyxa sp. Obi]|nr:hypothetical protein COCOBI_13-2140 [Coccomyxa sp. Obi]